MNILIADKLDASVAPALVALGLQVDERPSLTADELPKSIANANILVVRSTKVTAETLAAADCLSLIVRAGAGTNTIDVAEASRRGVYVANCPGVNAAAVAELAIGLLIAADRQIVDASVDLREGRWRKKKYGKAHGLRGRTLGVLGMGAIGQAVADAAKGLGMEVLGWSRSLTPERAESMGIGYAASPIELATKSDAVSVHLAVADETHHLVNADFLNAMRDGAILVNTSRGALVDTEALREAISRKKLRVGLDVFEDEPSGGEAEFADTQLAGLGACTPHIGASTAQTTEAIGAAVVQLVEDFIVQGHVAAAVNMCERSPATHRLVVRHLNQVGVLAGILDGLRAEKINVEEMDNAIFAGTVAAVCTLQLDSAPSTETLNKLRQDDSVLQLALFGQ